MKEQWGNLIEISIFLTYFFLKENNQEKSKMNEIRKNNKKKQLRADSLEK